MEGRSVLISRAVRIGGEAEDALTLIIVRAPRLSKTVSAGT